ncbi:hypothetical protein ACFQ3Z_03740 [Streptomyces nogalater]
MRLGPGTRLVHEGTDAFLASWITGQRLRLSASGAAAARLLAGTGGAADRDGDGDGVGLRWAELAARCARDPYRGCAPSCGGC